jgi:hypothetical protein
MDYVGLMEFMCRLIADLSVADFIEILSVVPLAETHDRQRDVALILHFVQRIHNTLKPLYVGFKWNCL